jgi:hypothetical protein
MFKNKYNLLLVLVLVIAIVLYFSFILKSVNAKSSNSQNGNWGEDEITSRSNNNNNEEASESEDNEDEEASESEDNENEKASKSENLNGELHRSVVANFVQTLLRVASRQEGGIGEQVRVVAQEQNQNREKTADQIESIEKRNKIKTFLIGTNYKNVGALRSEMVQTRNRLEKLNRLMEQTTNAADKTELQNQIQTLEEEQAKIETLLKKAEGKFSLFGWLVKLFNR